MQRLLGGLRIARCSSLAIQGAEEALEGAELNEQTIEAAATAAVAGAEPLSHNEYKIALTRKLLREALGNIARS